MSVEWLERDAHCAAAVRSADAAQALHPRLQELLATAVLASRPEAVDPMDRALVRLADDVGAVTAGAELVRGYPWLPELPALVQVWRLPGGSLLAAAKGAPEAIASALPPRCRGAAGAAYQGGGSGAPRDAGARRCLGAARGHRAARERAASCLWSSSA